MRRRYRGCEQPVPDQVRSWADPQIFEFLELAQRVDVSGFVADYRADGVGGLPYDPRLMLVTVWWCQRRQWRSPQEMARACREQASLRVVWQRERVPSAACLRRFVQGHRDGWQRVADSLLSLCDQAGLVDVSLTATDSTPVIAAAALSRCWTAPRITTGIDRVRQELAALRERLQSMTDHDLDAFVEHGCGDLIRVEQQMLVRLRRLQGAEALARQRGEQAVARRQAPALTRWQARVDKHRADLAEMTRRQRAKYDAYQAKRAAGLTPAGRAPCPPEHHIHLKQKKKALDTAHRRLAQAQTDLRPARGSPTAQASTTDPQARILKGKPNTAPWIMGRLLTITVIAGQIILAALLSPAANDYPGLLPNLTAATTRCHHAGITTPFSHHLADGGFAAPNLTTTAITGTPITPVTSRNPATKQHLYTRRSPMIEPVFAHLLRTDRHLHARGDAAHTEILALSTTYNATKYLKARIPRTRD
jgi:hypothetical protein